MAGGCGRRCPDTAFRACGIGGGFVNGTHAASGHRQVPHLRRRVAARHAAHVRPVRRIGAAGQGQDGGDQDQHDRRHQLPSRPHASRRHALHASAGDRRHGAPDGAGGRAASAAAGIVLVVLRAARRVHAAGQSSTAPRVEFENTNYLGRARKYVRMATPKGGHMFRAFDLNHSYQDCDVFVSLAKMKDHATAGVTLSMKNCFGITPVTIYGDGAGIDEPSIEPHGGRGIMHDGHRQPSKSAPSENDPKTPREDTYRVPRIVADLVAARPIDLAIVEAVRSMAGGEGPWVKPSRAIRPGVLVAGTNCVATDAVCMAVMGYDPLAVRGAPPFEKCDSTLQLAEELGVGPRDRRCIEMVGSPLRGTLFRYRV